MKRTNRNLVGDPAKNADPEAEDTARAYLPSRSAIKSLSQFLTEATGFPGRYKSPLGLAERVTLEFQRRLAEFVTTQDDWLYAFEKPLYPVPSPWQSILDYLYAEGAISSPHAIFDRLFHDEPKIFALRLFSVFGREPTDGHTAIMTGHSRGVSYDFEEAISKVIGEFLERYPLTIYQRKDFVRASSNALSRAKNDFLNIRELAGFAEWQKELHPHCRFDDTSDFFWVETRELLSAKTVLVPAQLVFWNYNVFQEPAEPYLRQPITNGAAGHFTREEAILAGIYENIQRDAFLIHWLNKIAPPRIDNATIDDKDLKKIITQFERYGFEVIFLNTTLDLEVPSCACVLVDTSGRGPRIAVGGGCGPNLKNALMRSITEALGVYHWLRTQKESFTLEDNYLPFRGAKIGQEKRLLLWGEQKMFSRLQFFLEGRKQSFGEASQSGYPAFFRDPFEELRRALQVFSQKGEAYKVYVYDAKHRFLDTLGYSSVRVIIPALVPLYLNEKDAPLGSPRLRSAPLAVGLTPAAELNPWPHPFP